MLRVKSRRFLLPRLSDRDLSLKFPTVAARTNGSPPSDVLDNRFWFLIIFGMIQANRKSPLRYSLRLLSFCLHHVAKFASPELPNSLISALSVISRAARVLD